MASVICGGPGGNEGDSPMLHASRSQVRWGRAQSLVLGGLLLAGMCLILQIDSARSADEPQDKDKDKGKAKAPAKAPAVVPWPAPPRMTIVAEGSDTAEMSKVINDKLEAGWKAN